MDWKKKLPGKLVDIGKKQIKEYKRGRNYYVRWYCKFESEESGEPFWAWSPSRTVHGRKADAESEAERYKMELELLLGRHRDKAPLSYWVERLRNKRIAEAARDDSSLSPLTVSRERYDFDRVDKYFGSLTLEETTVGVILDTYDQMREDGVSRHDLHRAHGKLSAVFEFAIAELARDDSSRIFANPCKLEVVKNEAKRPKGRKREPLTLEEATSLFEAIRREPTTGHTVVVWLALLAGVRRGEALGLTWGCVLYASKELVIRSQYSKDKKLRTPKTDESERRIAVDDMTLAFLRRWQVEQRAILARLGIVQDENTPVCTDANGGFIAPDNFNRWRRRYFVDHGLGVFHVDRVYVDPSGCKRHLFSGYEGKDLHCLRHTQATLLLAHGIDPKTVQGRLGHADASVTMNIYAHTVKPKDREAASALSGLLAGK